MILFSEEHSIVSSHEILGRTCAIFHSVVGCNLHCYKCHNYKELVETRHNLVTITPKDIITVYALHADLFDTIVFSGGEFLMYNNNELLKTLSDFKYVFPDHKIIVYTNGSFPSRIKLLSDEKLVDGFHMDIKFPYIINNNDPQYMHMAKTVIGKELNDNIIKLFLESIDIIAEYNLPMSLFRTVKYPFFTDEVFQLIKNIVETYNDKHKVNIPWQLNEFLDAAI